MRAISERDFDEKYRPQASPDGSTWWEFRDVVAADIPTTRVWSLIEGDDPDVTYASPGYHVVNVVGYTVTEKPWTDDARDAIYYRK